MATTPAQFFKYNDSPTIYTKGSTGDQAFSNADDFYAAGGAKDFSNVENYAQPTPSLLKAAPVYTTPAAPKMVTPSVVTSDPARTATMENVGALRQAETGLMGQSTNPAADKLRSTVSDALAAFKSSGQALPPQLAEMEKVLASLDDKELATTAGARQAAEEKDYTNLNTLVSELSQTRKNKQDYLTKALETLRTSQAETDLQTQLNDISSQERNTELRTQAGLNEWSKEQIPLKFIKGEQMELVRAANLQLQTLASQKAPLIDQLTLATKTREQTLDAIKLAMDAAGDDAEMLLKISEVAREMQKTQKEEGKTAKEFAAEYAIEQPFYNLSGTVYRTADGKAYSTPEQAAQDGVDTTSWSNVENISGGSKAERKIVLDLVGKYTDAGILPTDSLETARGKLSGSRIYQQQTRLADGSSPSSPKAPSVKAPPLSTVNKYSLPSTVSGEDFNLVNDAIKAGINTATGGRGIGSLSEAQRFDLWGQAAQDLSEAGLNPTDFDALLWEYFHPEGLNGFKTYVKGQQGKSSPSSSSANPFR